MENVLFYIHLEELPSTEIESLNSLLDMKYDENDNVFNIFDNSNNHEIKINGNFR